MAKTGSQPAEALGHGRLSDAFANAALIDLKYTWSRLFRQAVLNWQIDPWAQQKSGSQTDNWGSALKPRRNHHEGSSELPARRAFFVEDHLRRCGIAIEYQWIPSDTGIRTVEATGSAARRAASRHDNSDRNCIQPTLSGSRHEPNQKWCIRKPLKKISKRRAASSLQFTSSHALIGTHLTRIKTKESGIGWSCDSESKQTRVFGADENRQAVSGAKDTESDTLKVPSALLSWHGGFWGLGDPGASIGYSNRLTGVGEGTHLEFVCSAARPVGWPYGVLGKIECIQRSAIPIEYATVPWAGRFVLLDVPTSRSRFGRPGWPWTLRRFVIMSANHFQPLLQPAATPAAATQRKTLFGPMTTTSAVALGETWFTVGGSGYTATPSNGTGFGKLVALIDIKMRSPEKQHTSWQQPPGDPATVIALGKEYENKEKKQAWSNFDTGSTKRGGRVAFGAGIKRPYSSTKRNATTRTLLLRLTAQSTYFGKQCSFRTPTRHIGSPTPSEIQSDWSRISGHDCN
ncbi:hypothetical protein FN846DRAFT_889668 [Sphaerosporella brunnea]|uniref:Uncharacterized protein n=1 Tax=Sphaerosporella brunnea TaxID=1250544 RepID=A0A5J5EYG4_9PEZI|nr:hypothetical protein FN846DRAFT_889668 [Sphaerosporella brunnea]